MAIHWMLFDIANPILNTQKTHKRTNKSREQIGTMSKVGHDKPRGVAIAVDPLQVVVYPP